MSEGQGNGYGGDVPRQELEDKFLEAVHARQDGRDAEAEALYRELAREDPRLPEPWLELATLAGDRGDLEEAEALARTGLDQLRRGGQWIADLDEDEMLSFAFNLLGELLVRRADDVLLTDEAAFPALWNEAAALFRQAVERDPENTDAQKNAVHCRPVPEAGTAGD